MIEILRQHLVTRLGNDIANLDDVLECFKPLQAKRNAQLLLEGDVCRNVYFVGRGCLQVYVHDSDFNETTRDIVTEENWCSELISFGSGNPASENIRAVERSELFTISRQNFQQLMQSVPQFDRVYKQILEASYANSVYRVNTFVSMTALDRIKWMMNTRPSLMTRLPSKLIASYLGISQETFSRLKAKL
jgi:CRP-like cAMP-binding protein